MATTVNPGGAGGLLASLMSDEIFRPAEPRTLEETGLASSLVESLIGKYILVTGSSSGRTIAERISLPFGILEESPCFRQVLVGLVRTFHVELRSAAQAQCLGAHELVAREARLRVEQGL